MDKIAVLKHTHISSAGEKGYRGKVSVRRVVNIVATWGEGLIVINYKHSHSLHLIPIQTNWSMKGLVNVHNHTTSTDDRDISALFSPMKIQNSYTVNIRTLYTVRVHCLLS